LLLQPTNLTLKHQSTELKDKLAKTKSDPPQWDKLDKIIDDLLDCIGDLLPTTTTPAPSPPASARHVPIFNVKDAKWMPPVLTSYIESVSYETLGRQLQTVHWDNVTQAGAANPQAAWDELKAFMKTPEYQRIHAQIFRHAEFLDLLKFIHSAQYPTIYVALRMFFDSMDQVGIELPDGPDYIPTMMYSVENTDLPQGAGSRIPTITIAPPSIKAECSLDGFPDLGGLVPIFDILQRLNESNPSSHQGTALHSPRGTW